MKRRLFALMLAICLVFSLTGCDSVEDVEAAIAEIGTVTLESGDAIKTAKLKYDGLSSAEQEKVSNADELLAAEAEYERLNAAVDTAINAINAIGFVDLESGDAIALARQAYDALSADGLTEYVAAYASVLEQAEASYGMLYVENAYTQASDMYSWGDYVNAEATLSDAVIRFPNDSQIPACKELGAACLAKIAKAHYINGDLESAMNALWYCEAAYVTTEETEAVLQSVESALTQKRPVNGIVFRNSVGSAYGKFTVNASDTDACVKLELMSNPDKYILFYVRAGENATVYVPDGSYTVKYTTGQYWFGTESMFGQNASFSRADDIFTFETTQNGSYIYYDSITITLYTVVDGSLETEEISAEEF